MVEGGGSANFATHQGACCYRRAARLHRLLDVITARPIAYLNAQRRRGRAGACMVFDTWGGVLTPAATAILAALHAAHRAGLTRERDGRRVPSILFTKGGGAVARRAWPRLAAMRSASTGRPISAAARRPCRTASRCRATWIRRALCASRADPRRRSRACWRVSAAATVTYSTLATASIPRYDPEHALAMVEAVHELSPQYHQ